jgi:glucokinase
VISSGRLVSGFRGLGAEPGHTNVDPQGAACSCGQRGHLEAFAAGPAMARQANEWLARGEASSLADPTLPGEVTPERIAGAAQGGDGLARRLIRETGEILGRQMATFVHIFNPQVIVVGGGVAQIGEPLFVAMQTALRRSVMHPAFLEGLEIRRAALGDDSGLIGAMILAAG